MLRSLTLLALCACADPPTPVIEAHRGAAGYYPQNSRTAMLASMDDGYAGLEMDVVLTADGVPVLSHDPWVHETLCERVDGAPMEARVRIDGLLLEELQETYLCGGLPDPAFPNAVLHAESMMTFDELVAALRFTEASLRVHIDVKFEPGWTPPPEAFADAVLSRWFEADPPQSFYVSSGHAEALRAFEDWGSANAKDVPTSLSWPSAPLDADAVRTGLSAELRRALGLEDPVRLAEDAGADGVALYYELAERHMVASARARGLDVALWTLNDPALLSAHARWPVTSLITDFPGDLP
ncbi:MAG: glycerophosphodiester phosphodiesterase family protein [Myxococcota bacterium]